MTTATATRERPILFTGPMVRAILAGTKHQTRRLLKPQPVLDRIDHCMTTPADAGWLLNDDGSTWRYDGVKDGAAHPFCGPYSCPYGVAGDRLWVRETVAIEAWTLEYGDKPPLPTDRPWKHVADTSGEGDHRWYWPHYRATDPAPELGCERDNCRACESGEPSPHWTPSIHMPRWASRLTLEVTDVRVQRLQEITEDDARAEGVEFDGTYWNGAPHAVKGTPKCQPTAVMAYRDLWDHINGVGSWDTNPSVWAISFKRSEATNG